MTEIKRFEPLIDFPPYAFLPGRHIHPNKFGGYKHMLNEPEVVAINLNSPENNKSFRFGIDLINHGYFWESHVYFEALWNAHQRKGPVADFLKTLIKIAAAGIKLELGQTAAFKGHLERALELWHELRMVNGDKIVGFDISDLMMRTKMSAENTSMVMLPLYPSWK